MWGAVLLSRNHRCEVIVWVGEFGLPLFPNWTMSRLYGRKRVERPICKVSEFCWGRDWKNRELRGEICLFEFLCICVSVGIVFLLQIK